MPAADAPPPRRPWVWWKGRCRVSLQWFHHLTHRCVEKSLERRLPTVQLEGFLHHGLKPFIPPVLVLLEVARMKLAPAMRVSQAVTTLDATTDQKSVGRDTSKTGPIKLSPLTMPSPARVRRPTDTWASSLGAFLGHVDAL